MESNQTEHRSGRRSRAVATAAVAIVAIASLAFSGVAGGAGEGDGEASIISVRFEAGTSQGDGCTDARSAMSLKKVTTPDSYSFVVTLATDRCNPLEAKAAAYAMPDNRGWPWPQTLVETDDVVLDEAGVYTITFTKDCDPIQFDLLTGATPERIDPLGPHHGDLLFPHQDLVTYNGSAYQYWPSRDDCVGPTSSTSTPGSTSSTPTSEVPVTVSPQTSTPTEGGVGVPSEGGGPTGGPPEGVGGIQASQSPASLTVAG